MKETVQKLTVLLSKVDSAINNLDLDSDKKQLEELEEQMSQADFWSDPAEAEKHSRQAAELKKYLEGWDALRSDLSTTLELAELADASQQPEFEGYLKDLTQRVEKALVAVKLNGEYDKSPAILQISAGVGGTDAADWAQMLMEMYIKYANQAGFAVEVLDSSYAEEAGIKSATLRVSGPFAYGFLRAEKGVHRLVRLSPFNSDNLRQTSFALVDVMPEITAEEVEIDPKELKIDTYRSSGHGGQSVNTTDSAVRITHLPTGLSVSVQNERSQLKNKQMALSILASRLSELAREQHLEHVSQLRGKVKSADWGAQIRSYVLHPYQKVKDHRTGYETSDTAGVLSGKIEPFIQAYLDWSLKHKDIGPKN